MATCGRLSPDPLSTTWNWGDVIYPSLFLLFWVRIRDKIRIRVSIRYLLRKFVDKITSPHFHRWKLVLTEGVWGWGRGGPLGIFVMWEKIVGGRETSRSPRCFLSDEFFTYTNTPAERWITHFIIWMSKMASPSFSAKPQDLFVKKCLFLNLPG